MNTIEYLSQIKLLNDRINNKLEEKAQLYTLATKVSAPEGNPNKVQSSHDQDKLGSIMSKYVDLEYELDDIIDEYVDVKNTIIKQIEAIQYLANGNYYNVLHKKYVQFKQLTVIAEEMNYSYQRIKELHLEALSAFGDMYGDSYVEQLKHTS